MKSKRLGLCAVLLLMALICLWRGTSYFSASNIPRGFVIRWSNEHGIVSGQVMRPANIICVHCPLASFLSIGTSIIYNPRGLMPFHERVEDSRLRFAVDNPSSSVKTIYVIDEDAGTLVPIDTGTFDLLGIGAGIGSPLQWQRDTGRLNADKSLLIIHNNSGFQTVEVTVDLQRLAVVDVKVTRKHGWNDATKHGRPIPGKAVDLASSTLNWVLLRRA